ncbi:MAG: hypothetical protein IKL10_11610 [Clostridia bacterium]|nr:hypothetical protein [Clostridia bacterium]
MLKALLKKQLLEFFSGFFMRGKSEKAQTKGSRIGFICLMGFVFLAFFSMFFSMSFLMSPIIENGYTWIYFSIFGVLATLLGVFGSVFMTYNTLYEAKDNDMLLSMPIPSWMILFARMAGLYVTTFMFEALVLLPSLVVFCLVAPFNFLSVALSLLNIFVLPLFALSLSCVLGWVIALFASKIRNKGIITVIVSMAFFVGYYSIAMRLNSIINMLIINADEVGEKISLYLYPLYKMGLGCAGDIFSYFIFFLIVFAVFALIYVILSRSFIKLATVKKGMKKIEYKEKKVKSASAKAAFLKKEFLFFKNTPVYMLNCAMGSVMLILFAVIAAVKGSDIVSTVAVTGLPSSAISVIACMIMCLIASTNNMTSSAVSLEAKNLWFLKSVPVNIKDIFFGKLMLHILVTGAPLFICNICVSVVLKTEILLSLLSIVFSEIFMIVCAETGLCVNLIFPKLDWTNEAVPIKQSMSSMIGMFFGMILTIVVVACYFALVSILSAEIFLLAASVIFAGIAFAIYKWLNKKGIEKFMQL